MKKTPIAQYSRTGERLAVYESMTEAAEKTGVSRGNIWHSANFSRYLAGGYVFRYFGGKENE